MPRNMYLSITLLKHIKVNKVNSNTMDKFTTEDVATLICNVWGDVTEEQKLVLKANLTIEKLKKGAVIYNELEHPRNLIFLVKGKVKIHKEGVTHRNQIVRVMKPNGMFGFQAFFANHEYETSAVAFEESIVAFIPLNIVKWLIQSNASVGYFFVCDLSVKLGIADVHTINLTQKHVRGRLAEALLFMKDIYGVESDGCTLCAHISREEMANMSNMTTSNAIRTLSSFVEEKLVETDGKKVRIINEKGLQEISERG